MRRLRLLALLAPALLLPLACEDPSSSFGGVFDPEAGPGFEAGPSPEAGSVPEAGADSFVPPELPKGLTVTVVAGGTPRKDVRVLFHDATGAVTGDVKTDAAGKVSIAIAPSMVTVLATTQSEELGSRNVPVTFQGVVDGDNLVVDAPDEAPVPTNVGQYNVSLGPAFPGATDYLVRTGSTCTNATLDPTMPLAIDLTSECVGALGAVLATARDLGGFGDLAYGFVKNLTKPPAGVPLNVGPISFTTRGTTTLTGTNIPPDASSDGDLFAIATGISFPTTRTGGSLDAAGLTFATATGFADAYQATATTETAASGNGTSRKTFVRREATTAPSNAALTFDFATALPSIDTVSLVKTTVTRPDVTLNSSAPFSAADGAVAFLEWSIADGPTNQWTFILPPTTTGFKVPALPADAAAFIPNNSAHVTELFFVEASHVPGYTELKRLPVSSSTLALLDASKLLPAAGTVRVTRWDPRITE